MEHSVISKNVASLYERPALMGEETMAKMDETLEDIIQATETMMEAVKEISEIVNKGNKS